jgi:hypothetical protein
MATHRQRHDSEEWRMCSAIDDLNDYDRYEAIILPLLRKAVEEGWSTGRIRKELATFSQALVIQQALCGNVNRSNQLAAIQDVLDRYEGKSRRRVSRPRDSKGELASFVLQHLLDASLTSQETVTFKMPPKGCLNSSRGKI